MRSVRKTTVFNRPDRFVEGWYWALPSSELRPGQVKAVRLQGRELAVFRGEGPNGAVVAMDAYCPHMGAHLAQGRVDGNALRCFFHDWKFDASGACIEAPCQSPPPRAQTNTWPTLEKYGLIWVWTGATPTRPLPFVPELGDEPCDAFLGGTFQKNCHPNVMMINAIDEHHFNSVHDLPVDLFMEAKVVDENVITFSNTTPMPRSNPFTRLAARFYAGPLTYSMCYWFGSTGTVTVGPDFFHFHIMFSLRMLDRGRTEGQTVLITKKRPGLLGKSLSATALALSKLVGDHFAKGDTEVFETIKFDFKTPTKADHAIVDFVSHVEQQRALAWETWAPVAADAAGRVSLEVVA